MPIARSQRAAARALGVTLYAFQKALAAGRITQERDGSFDIASVRRQWRGNTLHTKRHAGAPKIMPRAGRAPARAAAPPAPDQEDAPAAPGAGMSIGWQKEREENERRRGRLLQMEIDEKDNRLVDGTAIEQSARDRARELRDALLELPHSLGPQLGLDETQTALLRTELERICERASRGQLPPAKG